MSENKSLLIHRVYAKLKLGQQCSRYTERKNLIESKRCWPMRYLFAANEIIYLIQ